jgi:hypothetical protein
MVAYACKPSYLDGRREELSLSLSGAKKLARPHLNKQAEHVIPAIQEAEIRISRLKAGPRQNTRPYQKITKAAERR